MALMLWATLRISVFLGVTLCSSASLR